MLAISTQPTGIAFKVHVQPGASCNRIVGLHGDAIKIKLTAPPVEGRANKACIEFLSKALNVAKAELEIATGQTSRLKLIRINCPASQCVRLRERLRKLVGAERTLP